MNEHDDQSRPRGLREERFSDGGLSGTGRFEDGEWTYWYKNGQQKAHGAYARGKLHGPWVWYRAGGGPLQPDPSSADCRTDPGRHHASGELIDRGVFAVGKKISEWVAFDPTGKPKRTTQRIAICGLVRIGEPGGQRFGCRWQSRR